MSTTRKAFPAEVVVLRETDPLVDPAAKLMNPGQTARTTYRVVVQFVENGRTQQVTIAGPMAEKEFETAWSPTQVDTRGRRVIVLPDESPDEPDLDPRQRTRRHG